VSKAALSLWLRDIPSIPAEGVRQRRKLANIKTGQVLHERKLERTSKIKAAAR